MKVIKLLLFVFVGCMLATSCQNSTPPPAETAPVDQALKSGLRHVVLFKFKEETTSAQIREIETAFLRLPRQIKEIKEFEWSNNNVSPEKLDQGFTHYYVLTFANAKGRNTYLPHPAHSAFGTVVGPHIAEDGVLVFDYLF